MALVLIFVLYAVAVLIPENPPAFVDYPDWVYQGVLFHGVIIHSPIPGYALKSYPVPNALTTIGIGIINLLVSWQWAGKLWICTYFLLAIFAIFRLARILDVRGNALWYALPGLVFLNLNFWFGHINFEFGLCVFLLFASMLFEAIPNNRGYAWVLVLLFFIHMEACACGVLLFICFCLSRRCLNLLWQCIPVSLLVVWYSIARFLGGNIDSATAPRAEYHLKSIKFVVFKIQTFFKTLGYVNVRTMSGFSKTEALYGRNLTLLFAGLSFLLGVAILILASRQMLRAYRANSETRFAWIFVLTVLIIAMMLPQMLLGTADPGSRLILVSLAMALFLIAKSDSKGMLFVALGSLVLCTANLYQLYVVGANPYIKTGAQATFPLSMGKYAHVEPETRLCYYQSLATGKMTQMIFSTALFYETVKHPQPTGSCEQKNQ
jgi:hypothetical protein